MLKVNFQYLQMLFVYVSIIFKVNHQQVKKNFGIRVIEAVKTTATTIKCNKLKKTLSN